jgi:hypothetical protein
MTELAVTHYLTSFDEKTRESIDVYGIVDPSGEQAARVHVSDIRKRCTVLALTAYFVGDQISFNDDGKISGHDSDFRPVSVKGTRITHRVEPPVVGEENRQAAAEVFAAKAWDILALVATQDVELEKSRQDLRNAVEIAATPAELTIS